MAREKRTRAWACLIYPRQAADDVTECPDNWVEVLEGLGVKAAVSPLHNEDTYTRDVLYETDGDGHKAGDIKHKAGDKKKPHRHVLVSFDGVKSEKQARELFGKIGGVGCEAVNSLYAQVRYLTHMDNPDKAQYSTLDVLTFGGFEYKRYAQTKEDEERDIQGKIFAIINLVAEKNLYCFSGLAEYLMTNEPELFGALRKNSYFFAQFLKSKQDFTFQMKKIY